VSINDGYLARVDAVEVRLAVLADSEAQPGALTSADPTSGERWDRGQVWAHLAEFLPYWIAQAGPVLAGQPSGEPVGFGRVQGDPERLGAIERDRREPVTLLWNDTRTDIAALRVFLAQVAPSQWEARGLHPTLGVMTVDELVEQFLVDHLEQHADQLESLTSSD
jgi:hypothetical protein